MSESEESARERLVEMVEECGGVERAINACAMRTGNDILNTVETFQHLIRVMGESVTTQDVLTLADRLENETVVSCLTMVLTGAYLMKFFPDDTSDWLTIIREHPASQSFDDELRQLLDEDGL